MRAGTITLRLGEQLVGIGCDTAETLEIVGQRFEAWIDESQPNIEAAFDLRFGTGDGTPASSRWRRSVPQLRLGQHVIARSRVAGDVVAALDQVLGGVLARQDVTRTWLWLRPFVSGDRAVLVDAASPALVNDPVLARVGIVELPSWAIAVREARHDRPAAIEVPAPLTDTHGVGRYELAGLVGVMPDPPPSEAALLARYGTRHTSVRWFRAVNSFLVAQQLLAAADGADARRAIAHLLR